MKHIMSACLLVIALLIQCAAASPSGHCSVSKDCNSHAVAVSGTPSTGCQCTCRNQWTGPACGVCPAGVDPTKDCAVCLPGFSGYPSCAAECTIANNCNNHAVSVSGDTNTGCSCTCRNSWEGASCGVCPVGFNPNQDCGTCAAGYSNYPECTKENGNDGQCTNAANCNGNAISVSGNVSTGCVCTCANLWEGVSCGTCPAGVNPSQNCGACLPGYTGYPNCARACTVEADCNGNAVSVSGNTATGCVCTCRNQWTGPACGICPAKYSAANDCATCATGRTNYPACTSSSSSRQCTLQDCNNHANAVQGDIATGCICQCRNQWSGTTCQTCPARYEASTDCGTCATGYGCGAFPVCNQCGGSRVHMRNRMRGKDLFH